MDNDPGFKGLVQEVAGVAELWIIALHITVHLQVHFLLYIGIKLFDLVLGGAISPKPARL